MMSPQFKGATKIYEWVIKDYMQKNKAYFEQIINEVKNAGSEMAKEGLEGVKSELNKPENIAKMASAANEAQKLANQAKIE